MEQSQRYMNCTGIAVIKDHRVLLGLRQDGQGWGLAGGKREADETLEECGKRELKEEFGLEAISLEFVGTVAAQAKVKGRTVIVEPSIYICRDFLGEIRIDKKEHEKHIWVNLKEASEMENLFPPSKQGIELVLNTFKQDNNR